MKILPYSILVLLMISINGFAETIELNSGQQKTTLIELYTSEGCSSCPPADRWVSTLKDDPKLWNEFIPIAFHVDYWDYIGWQDPFASPENSKRQRRYYREKGISSVYTPGFVSNGYEWRRWFGFKQIERSNEMPGELKVSIFDGVLKAEYLGKEREQIPLRLNVALLGFGLEIDIKAGENSGKTLKHDFVVIGQDSQKSFNGQWTMPLPKGQKHKMTGKGIAIWVSPTDKLQPIQSVGGWLP